MDLTNRFVEGHKFRRNLGNTTDTIDKKCIAKRTDTDWTTYDTRNSTIAKIPKTKPSN